MNLELAFLAHLTKTKIFKIYTNVCTAYMYIVQFVHTVHMYILVLKILRSLKKICIAYMYCICVILNQIA